MSNKKPKQNKKITRGDLKSECWRAADIMRRDDGTNGINEYIEQISWMFFLKVFEDLEKRFETSAELENKKYERIISDVFKYSINIIFSFSNTFYICSKRIVSSRII